MNNERFRAKPPFLIGRLWRPTLALAAALASPLLAQADTTPPGPTGPTTSGQCTQVVNGACLVPNGDFTIQVTAATDNVGGSGVNANGYRICRSHDTTGWGGCDVDMTLVGGTSFVVSGSHRPNAGFRRAYYFLARDNAGNWSATWNTPLYVEMAAPDTTPPGASGTTTSPNCTQMLGDVCLVPNADFTIQVTPAVDNAGGSGIATNGYRICRSNDTTGWGGCEVDLTTVGSTSQVVSGSHRPPPGARRAYYFRSRDVAGNWGPWNAPLYVETAASTCTAPSITSHPAAQSVNVGANVTFSVSATGTAPLTYQWLKNGAAIAGATSSTLSLANVQSAAAGSYTAQVSNSCGTRTSNVATLSVLAPCPGPGELEQALADVLQGGSAACAWQNEYQSGFPNAMGGGSFNKQVLAAAIAAVVDPNMAGPDSQYVGVRGWWRKYLEGELGDRGEQWAFGGKEPFSQVYQHYNIGAVMAMNYEFRRRGWTAERDLAKRWLRATFALLAAVATDEPSTFHDRTFIDPVANSYSGPWVGMAGMRSTSGSWQFTYRNVLFGQAVGMGSNRGGEPAYQKDLREFLEGAAASWSAAEGDIYGFTASEKTALAGILTSHQLPSVFWQAIAGIKTVVPYHIVGWPGVRVTLMESNRNFNTTPTYGSYRIGSEARFLYPWNRGVTRNCIRSGSASIDLVQGLIQANNGPAPTTDCLAGDPPAPKHPEETVTINALPGQAPSFQVQLPPYKVNW